MLASLCFGLWCVFGTAAEGQVNRPPISMSIVQEAYSKADLDDTTLLLEQYRIVGGVLINRETMTPFAGYYPLQFKFGPVRIAGGGALAPRPIPKRGTHANFLASFRLNVCPHFAVEYWHLSNARRDRPNPSIDSVGARFSW